MAKVVLCFSDHPAGFLICLATSTFPPTQFLSYVDQPTEPIQRDAKGREIISPEEKARREAKKKRKEERDRQVDAEVRCHVSIFDLGQVLMPCKTTLCLFSISPLSFFSVRIFFLLAFSSATSSFPHRPSLPALCRFYLFDHFYRNRKRAPNELLNSSPNSPESFPYTPSLQPALLAKMRMWRGAGGRFARLKPSAYPVLDLDLFLH